jgi:hypothetical protein
MFLHVIKKQNPNEKIEMTLNIFLSISWWIEIYLYKNNICNYVLENGNIFQEN